MKNDELEKLLSQPTASVPDVGRVAFGLTRNGSYEAAKRGDIQVMEFGKLKRVSTAWVRQKLGLGATASGSVTCRD